MPCIRGEVARVLMMVTGYRVHLWRDLSLRIAEFEV